MSRTLPLLAIAIALAVAGCAIAPSGQTQQVASLLEVTPRQMGVAFSQKSELQSCMATKGYDVRGR